MAYKLDSTSLFRILLQIICLVQVASSQNIYPDGGRNVIPLVKQKPTKHSIVPYNDGTVMAHVIGSAGMNMLYYFHILGVSCENTDPRFYKDIQTDFAFCMNKTGSLPSQIRNRPLGSIPKACQDWSLRKPCYHNLAEDYDECLANRPGLARKGTDALKFTHAYAKFICGNVLDTEAHLLDRYSKHDLIVDGVFQCFPHLQDRIVNCVKRDKISKTLCGKFYIVHACFGKYYNDDNCRDVQPIYYMDDLFRNMSTNLNCPKNDPEWPNKPIGTTEPPGKGWHHHHNPHHRDDPSSRGLDPRGRENPWPGESNRPWDKYDRARDQQPFIRDQNNYHRETAGWSSGWHSGEREQSYGRGSSRVVPNTTPNNRQYTDKYDNRPWVDVVDRGTVSGSRPWDQGRNQNSIDSRGRGSSSYSPSPRDPYSYTTHGSTTDRNNYQYSTTTQRVQGRGRSYQPASLPTAGYAATRSSYDAGNDIFSTRAISHPDPDPSESPYQNDDSDANFYAFK